MTSTDPAPRAERALSFGEIAGDYDRSRPGPPAAALDWLLPAGATDVVDVAAGTGKLTRLLLERVAGRILAVEPDLRMSAVLAQRSPRAQLVSAFGERLPLRSATFDAVFVSSAWHWLDPDAASREIGRVLRPGGRLAVLWSGPDREVEEVARVLGMFRADEQPPDGEVARHRHRLELPADAPFSEPESHDVRFELQMDATELIGLAATYSRVITRPAAEREAFLAAATDAAAALTSGSGGVMAVPMRCRCWRADRR